MYSRNIVCFVRIIRKHGVGLTFWDYINGINSDIVAFEEHGAENAGRVSRFLFNAQTAIRRVRSKSLSLPAVRRACPARLSCRLS